MTQKDTRFTGFNQLEVIATIGFTFQSHLFSNFSKLRFENKANDFNVPVTLKIKPTGIIMLFRKHLSAQSWRTVGAVLLMLSHLIGPGSSYVIDVKDQTVVGTVIFQAGLQSSGWHYEMEPSGLDGMIHVDRRTGAVQLKTTAAPCSLWPVRISATRRKRNSNPVVFVSIPLTVVIGGPHCEAHPHSVEDTLQILSLFHPIQGDPDARSFNEICFRRSELILTNVRQFIPKSIRNQCRTYGWSGPDGMAVESAGADVVSTDAMCRSGQQFRSLIHYRLNCSGVPTQKEAIELTIQLNRKLHEKQWRRRNRRATLETSSAGFFFDQPLYLTSVPEEGETGLPVITLNVRNPSSSDSNKYVIYRLKSITNMKLKSNSVINSLHTNLPIKLNLIIISNIC